MIFSTVGTQLPFDRLLSGLEDWAACNTGVPILAQAGKSRKTFHHIQTVTHLSQTEFRNTFRQARLIVAHAGMGTILSAAELGKPLILMPRRAQFQEHRNDHQLDTAREMVRLSNVTVVQDQKELHDALDRFAANGFAAPSHEAEDGNTEIEPLLEVIRDFVWNTTSDTPAIPHPDQGRAA
ncbi:MAG: glycosyltransferase family 28 protein [Rhodobacteraceae bacterium]|nr:glycosyltransferase family 28 protein [Paracoccaceae bacterium]